MASEPKPIPKALGGHLATSTIESYARIKPTTGHEFDMQSMAVELLENNTSDAELSRIESINGLLHAIISTVRAEKQYLVERAEKAEQEVESLARIRDQQAVALQEAMGRASKLESSLAAQKVVKEDSRSAEEECRCWFYANHDALRAEYAKQNYFKESWIFAKAAWAAGRGNKP